MTNELYALFDQALWEISKQHQISNLLAIQDIYNDRCYWPRLANLSFHQKLFDEHRYHFLYEVQGLSSQIHFGIASCFLFKDKINTDNGRPNMYNHRYTFMLESTIHCIYSYWNRVALVLNTYLKRPLEVNRVYFAKVIGLLETDYPELKEDPNYSWLTEVKDALNKLERNEFAHNNSLIMQNFLPKDGVRTDFAYLLSLPDVLLSHNQMIVGDIFNLVALLEKVEKIAYP